MNKSTLRAKNLRKSQTDAEKLLWQKLRNRQLADAKFKRQYVFGRYIVDFVCLEQNLIVEVDGGQHSEQKDYDQNGMHILINKDSEWCVFGIMKL